MRTLLTAAVAATALAAALPATAQTAFSDRIERLQTRIDDARSDSRLSWSDARNLRDRLSETRRLEDRYEDDGMTGAEARDIDARLDQISADLRAEQAVNQYRYERRWDDDR